jgi:hypothetical protein
MDDELHLLLQLLLQHLLLILHPYLLLGLNS